MVVPCGGGDLRAVCTRILSEDAHRRDDCRLLVRCEAVTTVHVLVGSAVTAVHVLVGLAVTAVDVLVGSDVTVVHVLVGSADGLGSVSGCIRPVRVGSCRFVTE